MVIPVACHQSRNVTALKTKMSLTAGFKAATGEKPTQMAVAETDKSPPGTETRPADLQA